MALDGFTMTEAQEILKRDYLPVVREQFPSRTPFFSRLRKGTEDVVGSEARLALRINRNQGVGARASGAALPKAGTNKYKQIGVETRNFYGRLQIEGKVFRAARSNRGAFLNAAEQEMKSMLESMQWDMNRMLMGGDGTGRLATLGAAGPTTTLTITASEASYLTRWIVKDMLVDILDASNDYAAIATDRVVTAVDKTNNTFTISGANITVQAGDIVVRAGSYNQELTGLYGVFHNTSLYGIDRSLPANSYFNANVYANPLGAGTNRAISEMIIQLPLDEVEALSGGKTSLMVSDHGVRRAYADLLMALKRYTEPRRLTGGWTALDYNGLDWVADPDCKSHRLYLLQEDCYKLHTMIPELWDWGNEDNQILREVAGYDAYEAFVCGYMELVCDSPNKQAVITDLTEL